jgi:hypothetical protein
MRLFFRLLCKIGIHCIHYDGRTTKTVTRKHSACVRFPEYSWIERYDVYKCCRCGRLKKFRSYGG